ncbi:hypothetical protein [Saccharopolyspora hattusasensis]|uniref:hypothetical protein n=1 Tax=Saccharopolyspora hattusasensis TaxID=1128679 RepID=UPI003D99A1B0
MQIGLFTAPQHTWLGGLFLAADVIVRIGTVVTHRISGLGARQPRDATNARNQITQPQWLFSERAPWSTASR